MPKSLIARPPADGEEERVVRRLAAARRAPKDMIVRAGIVAASWDGMTPTEISARIGCHYETVRRWINRFNEHGVDGLDDAKGRGRKHRISQDERSRIIGLVKLAPPGRPVITSWGEMQAVDEDKPGVWTLDTLTHTARDLGIDVHRSQVRRILLAEGVRWRRPRSWTTSKDPDFAPKERRSSPCTPIRPTVRRSCVPTNSGR
jgi:transposase